MRPLTAALVAVFFMEVLMVREVNAAALAIANAAEGCMLTGYRDPAGIATAGYGHTGPGVIVGKTYTMAQVTAWRDADMAHAAAFVATHVRVALNDNQFGALAEFTFNVGAGNFAASTLLRKINAGNFSAVPGELMRWTKAGGKILPGLVTRRVAEATLFTTPIVKSDTQYSCLPRIQPPGFMEKLRAWFARRVSI